MRGTPLKTVSAIRMGWLLNLSMQGWLDVAVVLPFVDRKSTLTFWHERRKLKKKNGCSITQFCSKINCRDLHNEIVRNCKCKKTSAGLENNENSKNHSLRVIESDKVRVRYGVYRFMYI